MSDDPTYERPTETLPPAKTDERTATLGPGAAIEGEEPALESGHRLGRYLILEPVGHGGMGRVYAAYDPKLGRKVALKVLKGRGGGVRASRLLREARALARLNHPNVLAVYDADEVDGIVFLTMEFVNGQTFGRWLESSAPSQRRILETLLQAGRGLEAAHRAELVHRDFKGSNVMVAHDGRVLVLDFGLARELSGAPPEPTSAPELARPTGLDELTQTGAVLGTPAFMAPEQRFFAAVGPAADQYSFCLVALWALTESSRPGQKSSGILRSTEFDRALASLPARLRRPIEQGLEIDPERRHASITELLARLEAAIQRPRRMLAGAIALALALGSATWVWQSGPRRAALCAAGAEAWADVGGEPLRRLRDTADSADLTPALADLDAYGERWQGMYRQACEATHRFGQQSQELLDLRMKCLERRRRDADTALALLESSGRVDRLGQVIRGLEAVSTCADTRALRSPVPPPANEPRLEPIRDRLGELKATWLVGDYDTGLEAARDLGEQAQELGYWPLVAEVGLEEARFLESLDQAEDADAALVETLLAAGAGSHLAVAAEASVRRVRVLGYQLGEPQQARTAARRARALVHQLSEPRRLGGELD